MIDTPSSPADLHREHILPQYIEATRIAPRGRGAPPKRDRLLAAAEWIHEHGVKLSDAPGSRCVVALIAFLDDWNRRHGVDVRAEEQDSAAAVLAGTLIAEIKAFEATMHAERWVPSVDGGWAGDPEPRE